MWHTFLAVKQGAIRAIEFAVIASVAILVVDVLWGVATRFLLGAPSRWTEELATFMLIWVALLSAAVAFDNNEHLGVDYLVNKFDAAGRRVLAITTHIVIFTFVVVAMIYGGFVLVSETLSAGQLTPALGIKMGYVYLAAPISGSVMLCTCIERIARLLAGYETLDKEPRRDS